MSFINTIENLVIREDIKEIVDSNDLKGIAAHSTIFVTGATGLIGSLIIQSLVCYSQYAKKPLKVIALVRSAEKARTIFGDMVNSDYLELCVGDINHPIKVSESIDYIIHGASATSSKFFVENPVETIYTALDGTRNVLEFAKEKKVKKVVYLSSLEVYGVPTKCDEHIGELDYGYIDPLQVRSSYSEGKRMVECVCASYAKEYGVPVTIARLSQTLGAGVAYNDGRVFAEFARCAIEGRDIVLHTQGNTVRTYCYITDAVRAIFALMLRGQVGEAYNVTNMDTAISIRDMAVLVCNLVPEKGIQVCFDIPENISAFGYNPEMVIRLNSSKLYELGWEPAVGIEMMFERLIAGMQNNI